MAARGVLCRTTIAVSLLVVVAPARLTAQTALDDAAQASVETSCSCRADLGPGVLWQGTDALGLKEIAALAAPVLWFSADEPLLAPDLPPIPSSHPCDAPSSHAVVYYQVTRLVLRGDDPVARPEQDDAAFFDKVDRFIIKFFFYYPEDSGVGGHVHDIESAEFEVVLERTGTCRRVRLQRVEGLAHGSRWYSNTLGIKADTKFPLTILVEEGKHASSPDRNADGFFMRGYDVTERVNDAWGIRDTLGQGVLLSAGYRAEMTKPRLPASRVLPPASDICVSPRRSSLRTLSESLGQYELRPANVVPACQAAENSRFLLEVMRNNGFGADSRPTQDRLGYKLAEAGKPDRWISLSLRGTEGKLGLAMVLKGLDLREGWIVPRFTANKLEATGEILFTRSASRWADGYVSGGVRWQYEPVPVTRTIETPNGLQDVTFVQPTGWGPIFEAGVKFRAELPPKIRPLVLGYSFGGARFGIQALGWSRIDQLRFVWEVGAGAW